MKPISLTLFAASLAVLAAFPLRASLVVYEGFAGYAAGSLPGQTVSASTIGLNSAATITSAGAGAFSNVFSSTGLTFSNLVVSGGSGLYSDANGQASYIGFSYTGAAVTGNLFSSYLVRLQTAQNSPSVIGLRANTASTSGGGTSYFHSIADRNGGTDTAAQYDTAAGPGSGTSLALDTTYVVIGRYTHVGEVLSVAAPGSAMTYVLSQEQFDTFKAGGFTTAELDAATIGSGPAQVFSRVVDANVTSGTFTFASGRGVQFGPGNAGAGVNQIIAYDEFRFGTTLDDVLPLPPPPPSTVSLASTSATASEPTAVSAAEGVFVISRDGATTGPLTVSVAVSGTATNGGDYAAIGGTVTIPTGLSSVEVRVKPYTDAKVENDETVSLTLITGEGYSLGASVLGTVTIHDRPFGTPALKSRLVQKLENGVPQKLVVFGTSLTANGAWPAQVKSGLDAAHPGLTTFVNNGGSGETSVWGLANVESLVNAQTPDAVFIEFSVNDSVDRFHITATQSDANLEGIITSIQTAHPDCEIILQVTNPVIDRPEGDLGWRPKLTLYQEITRRAGARHDLRVIDHSGAWQAVLDQGEATYHTYVDDGLHPNALGYERYVTPVILRDLGLGLVSAPNFFVDNTDLAQVTVSGTWLSAATTGGFYGSDYLHDNNADKGFNSFSFQPVLPIAGDFPVFLRWTSHANRATNTPVTVNDDNGAHLVTVNQRSNGGVWNKLGSYYLTEGSGNSVVIETTGTDGYVVADAVGIELTGVTLHASSGSPAEPASPGGSARTSTITLVRSGPTIGPLTVNLAYGGTAVGGTDYAALPSSVIIPAGAISAAFTVTPLADGVAEGDETLTIAAQAGPGHVLSFPSETSLVITDNPFDAWRKARFTPAQLADPAFADPTANPDGDARNNLVEFLAGSDPTVADAASFGAQGTVQILGQNYLTLTYSRLLSDDITTVAEYSDDLSNWTSGPAALEETVVSDDGETRVVTVRALAPLTAGTGSFVRVRVTRAF